MHNQHLYKSCTKEVYGHCRFLLPWLSVPSLFFCNPELKNCWSGWPGIGPTTLDLCSKSGAYDLSDTATPCALIKISFFSSLKTILEHKGMQGNKEELPRSFIWPHQGPRLARDKKHAGFICNKGREVYKYTSEISLTYEYVPSF